MKERSRRSGPAIRIVGALVLCLAACKTLPFPEPELEGDYGKVLALWTRCLEQQCVMAADAHFLRREHSNEASGPDKQY